MATTSIWSIKNNLKQSINYIINPEKTLNEDYGKTNYDYLEGRTDYNFKNEKVHYVSYLNCEEYNPYSSMVLLLIMDTNLLRKVKSLLILLMR